MNYTHLGRTGLKVSRLCLGTMNFGDVTDEKTSARILDEALEVGINFIDTADVYGTEQSPELEELGIGFVPYCPTARSFLAGAVNPSQRFDSTDRRHNLPRFQPDALAKNMVLLEFAQSWARRKNTTPVQFALAWVMAQRPWIVPIPGTTQYPHLIENSGAPQVRLTDSELREIDAALAKIPLQGGRADPFTESQFDKS